MKAWDHYKRIKKLNDKHSIDIKWMEYIEKWNMVTELVATAKNQYDDKIVKEVKIKYSKSHLGPH